MYQNRYIQVKLVQSKIQEITETKNVKKKNSTL